MEQPHSLGNATQQLMLQKLTSVSYNEQIKKAWINKDDPEEPGSAALPHLILLANNKTAPHSRLSAAQWLCHHKYGLSAAVTALIELAFDENHEVSTKALAQLEALDDPQATKALQGLVKWGANRDLRSTARHSLLRKTAQQKSLQQESEPIEPAETEPSLLDKASQKVELLTTSSMLAASDLVTDEELLLSSPLPVPMNITASQLKVLSTLAPTTAEKMTPTTSDSAETAVSELLPQLLRHDYKQPLWLPSLLLALTTIGELLFLLPDPVLGMGVHIGVLFLLLYSLVYVPDRPVRRLNTVLLLVPMMRIMSLGLPLAGLPQISWYFFTSIPIFAAMALITRNKDDPWSLEQLGLTLRQWPIQLCVALAGIGIGGLEYLILTPAPLSTALTLQAIWLPALILLISTGFLEELLFRGLLQSAAIPVIGRWPALILISALFAVLHIGYASVIDVLLVFAVGLAFSFVVERTHSILGVTLAHAIANISLYLILPHLLT